MLDAVAQINGRLLGLGIQPRDLLDLFGRDTADLFRPVRRVLLDVGLQFVVAMAPLVHEFLVDQILVHHHIQHAQTKGGVRAGADRHPHVRQAHIRLHGGLDGNEFGPAFLGRQEIPGPVLSRPLVDGLLAPDQDDVGILVIRHRHGAKGVGKGEYPLHDADAAVPVVRAAVGDQEAVHVFAVIPPRRREHAQGLGTVFGLLFLQFPGNDVQGLVIGDRRELAFAFGAHPLERFHQTVRGIDPLRRGVRLGTETTLVHRRLLHARHLGKLPVFGKGINAAVGGRAAHAAKGGNDLFTGRRGLRQRLLETEGFERCHAPEGRPESGRARPLQKRSAVE